MESKKSVLWKALELATRPGKLEYVVFMLPHNFWFMTYKTNIVLLLKVKPPKWQI